MEQVMILNSDKKIKAINLCDKLVDLEITFTFCKVGVQYTVCVAEKDVKAALS